MGTVSLSLYPLIASSLVASTVVECIAPQKIKSAVAYLFKCLCTSHPRDVQLTNQCVGVAIQCILKVSKYLIKH